MEVELTTLTTFEVSPDGRSARLHFRDPSGMAGSVVLSLECLTRLMMTLPTMIQMGLRNLHHNDSLRLVHTLGEYRVEAGKDDGSGIPKFIVTLGTDDGFSVAFAASGNDIEDIAALTRVDVEALDAARDARRRLC